MSNNCRKRFRSDRRGLATLEFAIVLPVLLLMCYAIVACCMFFFTKESLKMATAYEARNYAIQVETGNYGTVPSFPTFLNSSLKFTFTPPCSTTPRTSADVNVTATYSYNLLIPFIPATSKSGTLRESSWVSFSQ
jgi:Flp pilus assembly protein TadG